MIKMQDLIKAQTDMLREKFIHRSLHEADPPKPPSSGGGESEPTKLKINIPDSPFEPDASQITDSLKKVLKKWKVKQYMSDEHRWKEYYKDILKLVKYFGGEK